jgi:signal transduction histidine kinase
MDEETPKHISDKFYQGDFSHSQEGNGMGLALVKKVIDITGTKISVMSRAGKGTTFAVRLKMAGDG